MSQKVIYKFNLLVWHIMMNKIYTEILVRKFKLRHLKGDDRRLEEERNYVDSSVNMIFITEHDFINADVQNSFPSPQYKFQNVGLWIHGLFSNWVQFPFQLFWDPLIEIHVRCHKRQVNHGLHVSLQLQIQESQVGVLPWLCDWSAITNPYVRLCPVKAFSHSVTQKNSSLTFCNQMF